MSPFRQRAAKNLIQSYIFNGYRRLSGELVYWAIPFALGASSRHVSPFFLCANSRISGYGAYAWAKRYDAWQNSKAAHVAGHHGDH